MSKIRKILLVCLTAVCLVFGALAISACSPKDWREPEGGVIDDGRFDPNNPHGDLPFYYPEGTEPDGDVVDTQNAYVIHTKSMGGMDINNVLVTLSKDGELVIEGLSLNGGVVFAGIEFTDYDVSYSNLPKGYRYDEENTVKHIGPDNLEVVSRFTSSVITESMPLGHAYSLGDVMYDFTFYDSDNVTLQLSTLLQTKKVVVLNFWATWCSPCAEEFPALNSVYNSYAEDVEVIALSIESGDINTVINNYKTGFSPELTLHMGYDSLGLASSLGGTASVPTTIIIDRYGVIALRHVGKIPSELSWRDLFDKYTAEDYTQDLQDSEGGDLTNNGPVAVPDFLEFDEISDAAFNQALLGDSISDLHYYPPTPGTNDAKYNWPYRVAEDEDGMYIMPTNLNSYVNEETGETFKTDNTWAILYTDLSIEPDETLTLDVKLNTESGNDRLLVIINNSDISSYVGSGNTEGWITVELYKATRPTQLHIAIMYYKSALGTQPNEFVGLKNLSIHTVDYNSPYPIDLRSELSEEINGEYIYKEVYLADDGFYYVNTSGEKDTTKDSMIFVDIMFETLWSDRHILDYSLAIENQGLIKSIYNLSFWLFGNTNVNNFGYGAAETKTILNCFYIQDGRTDSLSPVTENVRKALEAFAAYAYNRSQMFGSGVYKNGHNENTWLELCCYYRTDIGDHNGKEADNKTNHVCKAHTNPGEGRVLEYAIELHDGVQMVDTTIAASINFMNGAFYKLTPYAGAGAYRIKSLLDYVPGNLVDPYILVWAEGQNAYTGNPLIEQDDSHGLDRFTNYTSNFDVIVYLKEGQTVYPQMTTRMVTSPGKYNVEVEYLGTEWWELRAASTGDGLWVGETVDTAVYVAISTLTGPAPRPAFDGNFYPWFYHDVRGELGSVVYIDFIHANFFDQNGHSLQDIIMDGGFKLDDVDYTVWMKGYLAEALEKDKADPTYGMIEANEDLVFMLSSYIQAETGESLSTGYWKAFAYYYHYYGTTAWEAIPEGWGWKN